MFYTFQAICAKLSLLLQSMCVYCLWFSYLRILEIPRVSNYPKCAMKSHSFPISHFPHAVLLYQWIHVRQWSATNIRVAVCWMVLLSVFALARSISPVILLKSQCVVQIRLSTTVHVTCIALLVTSRRILFLPFQKSVVCKMNSLNIELLLMQSQQFAKCWPPFQKLPS